MDKDATLYELSTDDTRKIRQALDRLVSTAKMAECVDVAVLAYRARVVSGDRSEMNRIEGDAIVAYVGEILELFVTGRGTRRFDAFDIAAGAALF